MFPLNFKCVGKTLKQHAVNLGKISMYAVSNYEYILTIFRLVYEEYFERNCADEEQDLGEIIS